MGLRRRSCKGAARFRTSTSAPIAAPNVKFLKRVRRVRDLVPAVESAFEAARSGVPGPAFVECPVDILYGEALVRQCMATRPAKAQGIASRVLRFYMEQHLASMFGKRAHARAAQALNVAAPAVARSASPQRPKPLRRRRARLPLSAAERLQEETIRPAPLLQSARSACPSISREWRADCLARHPLQLGTNGARH